MYGDDLFMRGLGDTLEIACHPQIKKRMVKLTLKNRLVGVSSPIIALAPDITSLTITTNSLGLGTCVIREVGYWDDQRPFDAVIWLEFQDIR